MMYRVSKQKHVVSPTFKALVEDAGMVMLHCDAHGMLSKEENSHWLTDLLTSSPMVRASLRTHCMTWSSMQDFSPVEAVAGIWFVPVQSTSGARHDGYTIGVIVTDELFASEYLYALCQASDADRTIVSQMMRDLPPASRQDVKKLSSLFQFAWEAHASELKSKQTVDSVGQELADSYEEISLLYTMTNSMNSVNHPERFIELACDELLETLPYAWIGVQLNVGHRLPKPGNKFLIAGDASYSVEQLSSSVNAITSEFSRSALLVSKGKDAVSDAFGSAAIIEPIVSDGVVLGVLIAGEKQGEDCVASSVDIKLLSATAAQLSIFLANALLYEDLNATFLGTLEALTTSIDAKDKYTCGHSHRVALLTAQLAEAAGFGDEQIERCRIAGLVHDIGKIGVSEDVLLKNGQLTDDEYEAIQKHPEIGARILKDIPQMEDVLGGVLHHHEKFDGSGYPHGLQGKAIPVIARMIAIADTFDAMSSSRTYRKAMTRDSVLKEMKEVAGSQFDPQLASLFFSLDFSEWERIMIEHQTSNISQRKAA